MNNHYFVLDSRLIEFTITNFKVEFSDVELDELPKNCRKDKSGQIEYNITNHLFVPFDEAELKEYLHNIKRRVKITADIKYCISKDCVVAASLQRQIYSCGQKCLPKFRVSRGSGGVCIVTLVEAVVKSFWKYWCTIFAPQ